MNTFTLPPAQTQLVKITKYLKPVYTVFFRQYDYYGNTFELRRLKNVVTGSEYVHEDRYLNTYMFTDGICRTFHTPPLAATDMDRHSFHQDALIQITSN